MEKFGDPEEICWKTKAKELQQTIFSKLGNREWDITRKGELTNILQNLGLGFYLVSSDKNRLDLFENICTKLEQRNEGICREDILFSCICVIGEILNNRFTIPVFHTKKKSDGSPLYFVDKDCRFYSSWSDYLKHNTLPKCTYCYPRDGHYDKDDAGNALIDFGTSPAGNKVTRKEAARNVSLFFLFLLGAAMPFISLVLDNLETKSCCLSITVVFFGVASGLLLSSKKKSAIEGEVIGKAGILAVDIVKFLFGIFICMKIYLCCCAAFAENFQLTLHDILLISLSLVVLIFCELKRTSTIIKQVQHDVIVQHRHIYSFYATKLFKRHTGKLRGPHEMHGNAKIIKILGKINNKPEIYEIMAHPGVCNKKVKLYPDRFTGLLNVNKELKVHPKKYFEMGPKTRQDILNDTQMLETDPTNVNRNRMKKICKDNRLAFVSKREDSKKKVCNAFKETNLQDIVINSKHLFFHIKPHEIIRASDVLERAGQNYDIGGMIKLVDKLCKSCGCKTVTDFLSYMEYSVYYLHELINESDMKYKVELNEAKALPNFEINKFNAKRGINEKISLFFKKKAFSDLMKEDVSSAFSEMITHFNSWRENVTKVNSKANPRFNSEIAATYHFLKHRKFGSSDHLTVDQYFEIASDLVGNRANESSNMLSQEGTCRFVTFKNPVNGAFGVRVDTMQAGLVVSELATVYCDEEFLRKTKKST